MSRLYRRVLASQAKSRHSIAELTSLQQKRNTLNHRIETWRKTQEVYMPMVADLLASTPDALPIIQDISDDGDEDPDSELKNHILANSFMA